MYFSTRARSAFYNTDYFLSGEQYIVKITFWNNWFEITGKPDKKQVCGIFTLKGGWGLIENPSMKCQGSQIKRLNDLKLASSLTSNQSILKIQIESDDQKKEN